MTASYGRRGPGPLPGYAFRSDLRDHLPADLRPGEVTAITATVETLRDLAQSHNFADGTRRAFVVARDVAYGMSRLFQAHAVEGSSIEVFRDIESAEARLGLRVGDRR